MEFSALDSALERIETEPRSGQSLLLFALFKTLSVPRGGHPYLLTKLREMNPDTRRIAYGLMELMAAGGLADSRWSQAGKRMDHAIGA